MAMGADLLQGARDELIPESLQATSDAPVDQPIADPHDEASEETVIDDGVEGDATAGGLFESGGEGPDLVRGERSSARDGGMGDAATRGSSSIRPRLSRSWMRLLGPVLAVPWRRPARATERWSSGMAGLDRTRVTRSSPIRAAAASSSARQASMASSRVATSKAASA
jgi:hypothetical protein